MVCTKHKIRLWQKVAHMSKDARRNISWTFSAKSILGKGIQANAPYNTHQTINAV